MKSLYFALILLPGLHSVKNLQGFPNLGDAQVILCSDAASGKYFKLEVLDAAKQMAHVTYANGGAPVIDHEAAYARSGAGFDIAVVTSGQPMFTALLDHDRRNVHVPRNGPVLPCGEAF